MNQANNPFKNLLPLMKTKLIFLIFMLLGASKIQAAAPTWSVNAASFQYNMTLVAVANINCVELANPSNRIGVFVGSQCRGTALTSQMVNGKYTASLFIYSNTTQGDTIRFKVYNNALDSVFDVSAYILFQQNASFGTSTSPYRVINNNAPTDIGISAESFSENTAINGNIATLSATDLDPSETFSYQLVSGSGSADNAKFSIVGNSLKLASAVDYEIQKSCSIRIRVSDGRGCSFEKSIVLAVQNFNETPSTIVISDSTIFENSPTLTIFATLNALDNDSGDAAFFSLVSGVGSADNASFNITGNSLRTTQVFNYEQKSSYSIRIRVRDGANNVFERQITILVKDQNDAPTGLLINGSSSATSFAENRSIGSFVATLSTIDEDANNFTYSFVNTSGGDNNSFQIVGNQLRSSILFDYETRQIYSVFIQSDDGNGGIITRQFLLNVTDSNDAPTAIGLSGNAIYENMAPSTFVAKLSTIDPDAGQTNFNYSLVTGAGSAGNSNFSIVNDTLYSTTSFNKELTSSYSIRIRTTDPSGASFSNSFTINILDANDAPTDINLTSNLVVENQIPNTEVGTLSTVDQDPSNTFIYTLVSGTGATDNAQFNISGNSLRTSAMFDFESKSTYSIRIKTNDGNGGTLEKVFTIQVTGANDAPTAISLSNNVFTENRPVNSNIGTFSTSDQDVSDAFTYSFANVAGNDNSSFVINGNSLRSAQNFNYESKSVYYIYITTNDGNGGTFTKQFQISIADSNDAPVDLALSSPTISENKIANSFIGQFSTTDQDNGSSFTYTLVSGIGSNDNNYFSIRNDSLVNSIALDFETKNTFTIRIRSTDNGGLSIEKNFVIRVINDNDAPTDLILSGNSINEKMSFNTLIGSFSSVDPDTGNTFSYSLVPGTGSTHNNLFSITGNQLRSFAIFNYETQSSYSIRVQTNDGNGGTYSKVFSITIIDINDAPENIILSNNTIKENKAVNSLIGTLSTTDEDTQNQFIYSFSTSQANDNDKFILSGNQLRSNALFDYESKQVYVVNLSTNDGNGGVFEKQFVINILDSNDTPLNIALSNSSINENATASTLIGILSTEDPDANQSFSYALIAGLGSTDNPSFSIRNDSLFSNATFNFENKASYSIRVRSTDNGNLSTIKVFTISITDQNDDPTGINLSANSITENLPGNSFIGMFTTTDADAVNNFSYTLVNGLGATDNALFNILGNQLKTNASFNYEAKNTYSIRVRSNDGKGGSFEEVFSVSVIDTNDAPTDIALTTTQVAENRQIGALIAYISTSDEDANGKHTYSFSDGMNNNNAQFLLINNQLRAGASFNFETKNFYIIYLNSNDGKGGVVTKQFVINVEDSTDVPTDMNLSQLTVSENLPVGTFIGVLNTVDEDQLNGFSYSFTGGQGSTNNNQFTVSNDSLFTKSIFNFEQAKSYSIRLKSTDNTLVSVERSFTIAVEDANDAPLLLSLGNTTLEENSTKGSLIGNFSTTDVDANDQHTYTLVSGTGSTDNTSFKLNGSKLLADFSADFEKKSSYNVRIRSTDKGQEFVEETFTINILDMNEKPALTLDTLYVNEGAQLGTLIGNLRTSDVDAGQTHSYSLVTGTIEALPFELSTGGALSLKGNLNYEDQASYVLTVQTTDNGNPALSDTNQIVVYVVDAIEQKQALPVTNYLSPNGDGVNDKFTITNVELYKEYSLSIYNDNGLEIYKILKDYANDWDGTYEGKSLPTGVYYYLFKNNLTGAEFKGSITLVNN